MSFATAFGQNKRALDLYQKAKEAFRIEDQDKGWKYLQKSMQASKGEVYQPFVFAGDMAFRDGSLDDALEYYLKSIKIQPVSSTYLKLSLVARSQLNWDQSIEYYQIYLETAKSLTPRRLADAKQGLEDLRFAKSVYDKFISGPNWRVEALPIPNEGMEYFPCITGDMQKLIFTHRQSALAGNDENLFVVERSGNGWSSNVRPVKGRLNSIGNEGAATISTDGSMMVFTACDRPNGKGSCDLFYSYWNPEMGWETPKLLPGDVNTGAWESQPSLAPDGRTLYFVRARRNTDEDIDIYQSTLDSNGLWTNVMPLPKTINSTGQEVSPFIHFDGKTLFFVSNQSPSIGGKDFFMSRKLTDSTWSTPLNMGMPLNGFSDEFSLVVAPSGTFGYFASDRGADFTQGVKNMEALDLYQFELPDALRPNFVQHLDAIVVNALTQLPIEGAQVNAYESGIGMSVFEGFSRPYSGLVRMMLNPNKSYGFTVSKEGYVPLSYMIEKGADGPIRLELEPLESGSVITLNNVLFELDRAELLPSSYKELNVLLQLLKKNRKYSVTIIGHTDDQGGEEYNLRLSRERAKAVLEYLVNQGIDPSRLTSVGKGKSDPVADNSTEEGRALNRRTEIRLD